ncbi:uncharacterized protein Gasu_56840 [Galdieria sulphuraria]|uniref:Uncharacterized protein n=1 Tax=Galdieria sulphuraria TaxID=130081 RepID=M2VU01_GALSU|nr:uncharacterized protein Gasu_56840 [Galdieria sulphuraria]EME26676.1 hypothetical protein Gasu_56840 [Galdieria sulphuraria]|eukprot:XP_005703196.1 hypothetical protein Gasu_56840 [Galdieria sulphuraria]
MILREKIAAEGVALIELEDYCLQSGNKVKSQEEAAKVIQSAFLNDPGMWWMATGHTKDNIAQQEIEQLKVAQFLSFLSEWEIFLCNRKGFVLLAIELETQEIVGVCCVAAPRGEESYLDYVVGLLTIKSTFWGLFSMQQRRAQAFGAWQKESRRRALENSLPILLSMIGVRPDFHGRGVGKALLQTLNKVSDDLKTPIYLETSVARNAELYMHFEYRIVEHLKRPVKVGNNENSWDCLIPMIRLPYS